jgi:hypothetical protein
MKYAKTRCKSGVVVLGCNSQCVGGTDQGISSRAAQEKKKTVSQKTNSVGVI